MVFFNGKRGAQSKARVLIFVAASLIGSSLASSQCHAATSGELTPRRVEVITRSSPLFGQIPWKTLQEVRNSFPKLHIPLTQGLVLMTMMMQVQASEDSMDEASDDSHDASGGGEIFNLPVAVVFAREVIEAAVVYTNFRSVVERTPTLDEEQKGAYKRAINWATGGGVILGTTITAAIGIGTHFAGSEINDKGVEIAEGISKLIASYFVAKISLQIPRLMSASVGSNDLESFGSIQTPLEPDTPEPKFMSQREIAGTVFWNVLRESAEIGIFLIPSVLAGELTSIPVSGGVGIAAAGTVGAGLYLASKCLDRKYLAAFSATVSGLLATGLFSGSLHELEEAAGETPEVYDLGKALSSDKFPMVLLSPFGYSSDPTVLQTVSWISFAGGMTGLHLWKNYPQVWDRCWSKVRGGKNPPKTPEMIEG